MNTSHRGGAPVTAKSRNRLVAVLKEETGWLPDRAADTGTATTTAAQAAYHPGPWSMSGNHVPDRLFLIWAAQSPWRVISPAMGAGRQGH